MSTDQYNYEKGQHLAKLHNRSGQVNSRDKLVSLLYVLLTEHLTAGAMEEIMRKHVEGRDCVYFQNGWVAEHAKDIAERLK